MTKHDYEQAFVQKTYELDNLRWAAVRKSMSLRRKAKIESNLLVRNLLIAEAQVTMSELKYLEDKSLFDYLAGVHALD